MHTVCEIVHRYCYYTLNAVSLPLLLRHSTTAFHIMPPNQCNRSLHFIINQNVIGSHPNIRFTVPHSSLLYRRPFLDADTSFVTPLCAYVASFHVPAASAVAHFALATINEAVMGLAKLFITAVAMLELFANAAHTFVTRRCPAIIDE